MSMSYMPSLTIDIVQYRKIQKALLAAVYNFNSTIDGLLGQHLLVTISIKIEGSTHRFFQAGNTTK
ncbi:hypothetical protein SDC9_184535 [bioreactor metagenome]|uniref:Uncharacterized protein n=1 Tax=bioreactor metagenome TaxID=1076179 RepID=A0A645HNJ7_9ZZZZ